MSTLTPNGVSSSGNSNKKTLMEKWEARFSAIDEMKAKWAEVGLAVWQKSDLDSNAVKLANLQEQAAIGRKNIGGETKAFAHLSDEEKVGHVGPLIKAYQQYIDELTKSFKSVASLYSGIHEVVRHRMADPVPLLDRLMRERSNMLEYVRKSESLEEVQKAVVYREAELAELKNQEVTIKQLRERLSAAELNATALAEQSTSSHHAYDYSEVLEEWQRREQKTQQDVFLISQECRKLKLLNDGLSNQLSSLRGKLEELETARDSEHDAMQEELQDSQVALKFTQGELERVAVERDRLFQRVESSREEERDELTIEHDEEATIRGSELEELQAARDHVDALKAQRHAFESELRVANRQLSDVEARETGLKEELQIVTSERDNLAGKLQELEVSNSIKLSSVKQLEETVAHLTTEKSKLEDSVRELMHDMCLSKPHPDLGQIPQYSNIHEEQQSQQDVSFLVPPSKTRDGGGGPTTKQAAATDEAFLVVASQRDKLRQRLNTLEEITSNQIHELKMQIRALRDEREEMVRDDPNSLSAATTGNVSPSLMLDHTTVRIHALPHLEGRSLPVICVGHATRVADHLMSMLSRLVMTNLHMRRLFAGYLIVLHLLVFLTVASHAVFVS